jgi:ribosomal protein L44E
MNYSKTSQLKSTKVKTKHCPKCNQDLLVANFSSTRSKFCKNCKKIIELEQKQTMTIRALNKSQKKKQKKEQGISIANLKKKVQRVFNKYIRLRDQKLKCISCGQKEIDQAGHYIAQGSSGALRFNEDNVNGQCTKCNVWDHGNLINYRINLVKKIGEDRVKWLEDHRTNVKRWTREELEDLLETYKRKIKEIHDKKIHRLG